MNPSNTPKLALFLSSFFHRIVKTDKFAALHSAGDFNFIITMQRNIFFLKVTKNEGVILHKKSRKLQKRNFRDFFRRASRPHSIILIQPHRHRESKLDVARPVTRGYQRIRDVVVVVEADFETL